MVLAVGLWDSMHCMVVASLGMSEDLAILWGREVGEKSGCRRSGGGGWGWE